MILLAVPTQSLREVLTKFRDQIKGHHVLVSASKGIELKTYKLPIDIISDVLGTPFRERTVVLSGPSFAVEIMERQPTAVSIGSENRDLVGEVQEIFHSPIFRAYGVFDPTGLEVAGALKNVIAIASGACGGLGFKLNSRAALITRGLSEITRFGIKLGANPLTFKGLGGVGDLFLTASSEESRNYRVGFLLGQGKSLPTILQTLGSIAEGVATTQAAYDLAQKLGISAPITTAVYSVLYGGESIKEAVVKLISSGSKDEFDY